MSTKNNAPSTEGFGSHFHILEGLLLTAVERLVAVSHFLELLRVGVEQPAMQYGGVKAAYKAALSANEGSQTFSSFGLHVRQIASARLCGG